MPESVSRHPCLLGAYLDGLTPVLQHGVLNGFPVVMSLILKRGIPALLQLFNSIIASASKSLLSSEIVSSVTNTG